MKNKYIPLFKRLEEEHQCSGGCDPLKMFVLSSGLPLGSCFTFLQNTVVANTKIYMVGFACIVSIVSAILIINQLICLRKCKRKYCPAKKKGEKKKLTERS
jgi:Na+/melibiose symporter-like transporter